MIKKIAGIITPRRQARKVTSGISLHPLRKSKLKKPASLQAFTWVEAGTIYKKLLFPDLFFLD
jgi:hypothetical protein